MTSSSWAAQCPTGETTQSATTAFWQVAGSKNCTKTAARCQDYESLVWAGSARNPVNCSLIISFRQVSGAVSGYHP